MLGLREEPSISRNLDVALPFWMQVVCILSTSLFFLPHLCFIVGTPYHRSRSSCQFSVPEIKSGLLAVVVFCRCNWKSHTSFALLFSSTVSLSYHYSYQMASWPTISWCFVQATATIISTWLCLVRYSLFASLVHPATRCSTVSGCWVHILQLPSSVSHLTSFHDLFSIICSNIVIIASRFEILLQPHVTFLLLPALQFTFLLFRSVLP